MKSGAEFPVSFRHPRTGAAGKGWFAALLMAVWLPMHAAAAPPGMVAWQAPEEVASGAAYRGPWRMNRSRFYYVDDPAVDVARDGGVGVAWVDNRRQNVLFQRFEAGAERVFNAPVEVSRSAGTFSWLPKVVVGDDGQAVFVLWQEIVFSGGSHGGETFFSRSRNGGRTFSAPVNLSESPAGDGKGRLTEDRWNNGSLDLALGHGGDLYAAWTEYEGTLWLRRSTDGGKTFDEAVRVGGSDESPARGPSLAVAPDGTLYLAWAVGEDQAADIQLAVSRDGGRSFGAPRALFASEGHSDAPSIAVDADGAVHLVYAESPSGMFGNYHLRYARLAAGGEVAAASRRMDGCEVRSAHFPSLSVAGDAVFVAWERFLPGAGRPRGLGFTLSSDGGATFAPVTIVPGTDDPALDSKGGLQGLFMRKLAVNGAGDIAVVNSRFDADVASRVRLIRGRIPGFESTD